MTFGYCWNCYLYFWIYFCYLPHRPKISADDRKIDKKVLIAARQIEFRGRKHIYRFFLFEFCLIKHKSFPLITLECLPFFSRTVFTTRWIFQNTWDRFGSTWLFHNGSSHRKCSLKNVVLKNYTNFSAQACNFIKKRLRDFNTGAFPWNMWKF